MRKSIILASLLIGSSAFAQTFYVMTSAIEGEGSCGQIYYSDYSYMAKDSCPIAFFTQFACADSPETSCPECRTMSYTLDCVTSCPAGTTAVGDECKPDLCPAGQTVDGQTGYCMPSPLPAGLHAHDGDEAGCNNAGGYYMANTKCNTLGEAVSQIFTNPTAVKGALLTVGGLAFGAAGFIALPMTVGGSSGAMVTGGLAVSSGLGMMGFAAGDAMFNKDTSLASNDVTTGEYRMKISLKTVSGAGGGSASVITKTNTTSGKVEQASYIPPSVKADLANAANVNDDGSLKTPISFTGIQETKYNYQNNTATTTTHETGSTSANPVTSTKITPITVTQNFDGTTTTNTTDPTVAPSVTGSGGGSVSSSSSSSSTGWGTGTGTTSGAGTGDTGTGPDYTGVLNEIKINTGNTATYVTDLIAKFTNTDPIDTSTVTAENSDGHDKFGDYEADLKASFDGFIITDPLGLNNIAGGSSIPEYGFTIMGHHFTILDQALLNKLPLDLLRGLFMFMAALAGVITVFSGV